MSLCGCSGDQMEICKLFWWKECRPDIMSVILHQHFISVSLIHIDVYKSVCENCHCSCGASGMVYISIEHASGRCIKVRKYA